MDVIAGSTISIQRALEKEELVDIPVLTNHADKIKSLEGELHVLKKEILPLDDFQGRLGKASHIEQTLSDLRVMIYRLLEKAKKEPDTKVMPMMSGINLPRIEIPTFDGNILNCRLFGEQFQATVHDKPHLGEIDKLT